MRRALALALVAACSRPADAPKATAAATLTYLGVAGWSLATADGTLLVDPYVTRASVEDDAAVLAPDEAAIARFTPEHADAILVGHSHYDHLLDVPPIAKRTHAVVVGTESSANVARAAGVEPARLRVVAGGETVTVGPFTVRAVPALHSLTGQPNEPIAADVRWPMPARSFAEGGTLQYLVRFGDVSVYFVGTANLIEDQIRNVHADVAVLAVGLRAKVPDYTCRLLRALGGPRLVLPSHFDAFREPLRPGELPTGDTCADLNAFAAEVHACFPSARVEIPLPLRPIPI